jgi:DNA polymerase-3 subunit delta'
MSLRFDEILGQSEIKDYFKNAIEKKRLVHAYIISGEDLSGKMMMAETVACALLCEEEGSEPCNECTSCHKVINHNHPDVIYVQHEKPNNISVDEIREQLVNTVLERPYSSDRKIYIVPDAEKMNQQAQNALLKTIEEPPSFVTILLLTNNQNAFLPTILSRCVKIALKPVDNELVEKHLMEKCFVPDYIAKEAAAFAQGNVGLAVSLVSSDEFKEEREAFVSLISDIRDLKIFEIAGKAKELSKNKEDLPKLLNVFRVWFRDVLLYKATNDDRYLIYGTNLMNIESFMNVRYESIEKILKAIDDSEDKLRANVNPEQVIELLLVKIKEYIQ